MTGAITSIQFLSIVILSSGFIFGCCSGSTLNVSCMRSERQALLKFKQSLTDPSARLSSWVGADCCRWIGVVCSNRTGNVIKLKLRNQHSDSPDQAVYGADNALGGQISASLLQLKQLKYLDLSMNNFQEIPIPNFIGSLKTLRYLNLSGASFSGLITPHIGNLSSLRYLDLNSYSMEMNENGLDWLSGLSSLRHLNLGKLDLSKAGSYWVQAVNMLPSLSELHLPNCGLLNLSFPLSPTNLTSLSVLDLSENGFNSSIPPWLFNLSSLVYLDLSSNTLQDAVEKFSRLNFLEYLDLSHNLFEGSLSGNFGKLCNLHLLDLSFNNISGEINDFTDSLAKCSNCRLETLHLGYNNLGGSLPSSLGYLKKLKFLMLMKNSFSGSIPESFGNLSSLKEFSLSENTMKGSIPVSLGKLSALTDLDIKGNQWEGVITEEHFSNLTNLKELNIMQSSKNVTLVFNVSHDWIPPFKLTFLELKACLVGPDFPRWLRYQNALTHVAIWYARISGRIPDWFWKLDLFFEFLDFSYNDLTGTVPNNVRFQSQSVVFLNYNRFTGPLPLLSPNLSSYHMDNNFFSGPIPLDFGERMPLIADLDISFNMLNGSIPSSIANLTSLFTFVLANNYLTGQIPEIWNSLPSVYLIDVSNNSLSGNIPTSLGSLTILQFLRLSRNNLSGEIPPALQNCTILETLDLGDNRISGNIPQWIMVKMPSLLILRLRNNLFIGEIPSQICSLSSLHILDLAENKLSGHIPKCVGNLTGMTTVLDAMRYEGQLLVAAKGTSYYYDQNLFLVNSIDISSNNLSGEMPPGLSDLSRLGTLNLSMNHLSGSIPANIGNLLRLETLDLSRNNLSGSIPPSMASITSLNHLNLAYNNLSGRIPSSNQFQTFNDPSMYEGNPSLCGQPLPTNCRGDNNERTESSSASEDDDNEFLLWFYIGIGSGFAVGFWGVGGILMIKKSWRHAYFRLADDIKDRLMVSLLVNLARLKRLIKRKEN